MATENHFPRILVISTWFGPLPAWFPLWLTSCRFNPDLDWLVATDANLPAVDIPKNVHVVRLTMAEFAARIEQAVGFPVHFVKPYKACDYRPLYGCLTNLVPGDWEFWGHCDLDMLFGNVRAFLTPELLASNDRVFGVGHFSIYRNDETANTFYRRPYPGLDYHQIIADPEPRGFDEHNGVNLIWHFHGGRFYEDESVIADIDPHISSLRRTSSHDRVSNYRRQIFCFNRGRVLRFYLQGGQVHSEEFMYVHFQKRRFVLPAPPYDCERAWLTPSGFVPMDNEPITPDQLAKLNPSRLLPHGTEILYRARRTFGLMRRWISKWLN